VPEIIKIMTVKAPLERTWRLVSDMSAFSRCIPGCKEVKRISDTEYDWTMEAKVLRTTRKVQARTRAEEMRAPVHSKFVGEGRLFERSNHYKLSITGTTDLEKISDGETRIKFAGVVEASGAGGPLIEKVASGQMDALFQEFERNVKATLEGGGG
jgi:carbon monoxide dehydrogenase subunit G